MKGERCGGLELRERWDDGRVTLTRHKCVTQSWCIKYKHNVRGRGHRTWSRPDLIVTHPVQCSDQNYSVSLVADTTPNASYYHALDIWMFHEGYIYSGLLVSIIVVEYCFFVIVLSSGQHGPFPFKLERT